MMNKILEIFLMKKVMNSLVDGRYNGIPNNYLTDRI
jgi:hypothetical protein